MKTAAFAELPPKAPALAYIEKESASQVARRVKPGCRIVGLTRGQFSLIDLIYSILQQVGPSEVTIVTWSAGIKDANTVKWMVDTDLIRRFLLCTDHSYKTRQPKYAVHLSGLFGEANIRTSDVHAKFVLIGSDTHRVTIRTSMNLNANRTCESFEIDEDPAIYEFYAAFVRETFGQMPEGFTADSATVNRALDRVFDRLKNQFDWQNHD